MNLENELSKKNRIPDEAELEKYLSEPEVWYIIYSLVDVSLYLK